MKLKKILALLTILLLALTACKSTEDPVDDKKPLKLSERVGVYKLTEDKKEYVVEVKDTGNFLLGWGNAPIIAQPTTPNFSPTSTETIFNIKIFENIYKVEFLSETQLKMSGGELPVDTIKTLTKQ